MKLWILALALSPGMAAAQDIDCMETTFQQEMNWCAEQDWNAADADLNDAYMAAMAMLKDIDASLPAEQRGGAEYLKTGQRAWIEFRDATCAAEGFPMRGGSAEPLLIYGCLARLTKQRAEDLWILGSLDQ